MSTAEEGGATANNATTNSYYGGAGAGGKLRKYPLRRQTTPYDRPPTALRVDSNNVNNNSNSSWLTKLVVDPASRLISYGAHRLFGSVFAPRLPPPQPPKPPEIIHNLSEALQGAVANNPYGASEFVGCECGKPINSSSCGGISELEQLLKQNNFSRCEIDHLTELLQSRAIEVSPGEKCKENEETALVSGGHENFESVPLDENRNEGIGSRGVMKTPISNLKVLEDDIGSPAELAKAYMGSRPSKVSPSMLGIHSQVGRGDAELLNNVLFASKSPIMPLKPKIFTNLGTPVNKYTTPRSGGRSAIYNMARTPYSRVHLTSTMKGGGIKSNDCTELSVPSPLFSLMQHGEKYEPKQMTLKRRRSGLDDEVGSDGRIQRIRQKPDLFVSRIPHTANGIGIGSAKKLPLIGKSKGELLKSVGENENESVPSTSHTFVPNKSSEVAARILQHLENLSPMGKLLESKLVSVPEKSPLRVSPDVIHEGALRSMGDVDSSRHAHFQDDHKMKNIPDVSLLDSRDSTQNHGRSEETGPKKSVASFHTCNPVKNNVSAVSLKASGSCSGTVDHVVGNGASQPPQKTRAFTVSGQKESLEQKDSIYCNRTAPGPFVEERRPADEVPKSVKTAIQSEVKSLPGPLLIKTNEVGGPGPFKLGEGTVNRAFPNSENTSTVTQSAVLSLPATAIDKPKNADNPQFFTLPSESISKTHESKFEISCSLVNLSPPTLKTPESENVGHLDHVKAADGIGKPDTGLFTASNGPVPSNPPALLFTTAFSNHTNQISTGAALLFNSSTSVKNFISTCSAPELTGSGSYSTGNNVGGSVFSSASKSLTSVLSASSAPFNMSSSTSFGSSFFNPQASIPNSTSSDTSCGVSDGSALNSNGNASSGGTFSFGLPPASYALTNTVGSADLTGFVFGGSSSLPGSVVNNNTINSLSNDSSIFGSMPSSTTGYLFGDSSSAQLTPMFSFTAASALSSTPSQTVERSLFGNLSSAVFTECPLVNNNDQTNAEDSMAEDHPVQSSSPGCFMFGQTAPLQSPVSSITASPFQALSSVEFNASGSFSLGHAGGDKSKRRVVRLGKVKNRKR